MNHHHTAEAQTYQSIGELAPEAEAALTAQKGWDGIATSPPTAIDPIDQIQSHTTSFWNDRANLQTLATTDDSSYAEDFFSPVNHPADIPPIAGYDLGQGFTQTPTAATDPEPFDSFDPGVIQGASASTEQSGNAGFLEPAYRSARRSSGTE
jgi:hypothetical protein